MSRVTRAALALFLVAAAAPAFAQETQRTVEQVTAEANSALAALRAQRDEANDRIVHMQVRIDRLTKELTAAKAAKPEGNP